MTDPELVEKKLAFIEARVRELRELGRPEQIARDIREERFVAHTLQLAIQAALDVASHIVSDDWMVVTADPDLGRTKNAPTAVRSPPPPRIVREMLACRPEGTE